MKVTVNETKATVTINKETREYDIAWVDGMPRFVECPKVGVIIGKQGSKLWYALLTIKKHPRYNPNIPTVAPQWTLEATEPLNSINRNFYKTQISDFWDNVPEEKKSKR